MKIKTVPDDGDCIFVHNKFRFNDLGTWMAPFIRKALSVDNMFEGVAPVYYNHCANVVTINGVLHVVEAGWNKEKRKAEVISTPYSEWLDNRKQGSFVIYEPEFEYDKKLYKERLIGLIGTPYYFAGVFWYQLIFLISNKWFGRTDTKKVYCAQLSAFAYDIDKWYSRNPETLQYHFVKKK